jgi:Ca-activated chloride channel family protein
VLFSTNAFANGLLVPTERGIPALSIKYQSVDIHIMSNVSKTKVVQEFYNNTSRRLEANYVFPLPEGASISDFAMFINGKRMSGELVEKQKAKQIYENIVRKMKDPALLEYMGNNLFRARVFPIEPHSTQRIELEYSQILAFDNNVYSYVYPLRTGMKAARTLDDFTVAVDLKSKIPIKNIYSPTHEVGISRKDDYHAVIGFEKNAAYLNKDFKLFYTVSEKDIGLNLFTYKTKDDDGYFMLMLAPKTDLKEGEVSTKNIVFTIDTSGSMAGRKMQNAINALTFGINNLNKNDRFNIVRFSTDVEPFSDKLVPANKKNIKAAIEYTKRMHASGGTAIDYALTESLKQFDTKKGTNILVFITDGLPTVGTRDIKAIIGNAKNNNLNRTRVFGFGVGHDVNTVLLDAISKDGRGMSEYMKADEEMEIKLSNFFRKVANPVLSNITIDFDDVQVNRHYPRETPDIFKGEDLVILGRYKGSGATAIRLKGTINNNKRELVYEGTFTKADTGNDFIPRLWAVRRVGYLLEEIKLHGEAKELKDEVITLSKAYGIMTPYTSYLVLENEQQYSQHNIPRKQAQVKKGGGKFHFPSMFDPAQGGNKRRKAAIPPPTPETFSEPVYDEEEIVPFGNKTVPAYNRPAEKRASGPARSFRGSGVNAIRAPKADRDEGRERDASGYYLADRLSEASGERAVKMSKDIRKLKEEKVVGDDKVAMSTKVIKERTFNLVNGYWTQTGVTDTMKGLKIKYLSDAYFNVVKALPDLKDVLALGEKIKLIINGKVLIIDEEGIEEMTVEKIKEFYKK